MLVYNILIRFYFFGIWIASFFSIKAKKWIEGRKNLRAQIGSFSFQQNNWIWFHCSSFGEFQEGRNLIEAFRAAYPNCKLLLTFFSPSGYEVNNKYAVVDLVLYLPLDKPENAQFFLDKIRPKVVFFIRSDVWPNYIIEASKRKIPVFLASFTLTAGSSYLKFPVKNFYRNIFQKCKAIFVQNEEAAQILRDANFNSNILVTGSSRIDRIITISKEEFKSPELEKFIGGDFCVIAGSTHSKDREIFLETYSNLKAENIKWIIVPHDIDKNEILAAKRQMGEEMVCFSEIEGLTSKTKLLWIDKVGLLAKIYRYTNVVFIGGGFTKPGIHNILEPAVYGCPVCFGPNHRKQKEALDLIQSRGAEVIQNAPDLSAFILKYKNDKNVAEKTKVVNKNYLLKNAGGTNKIMKYLKETENF
jgi:3-deoxy-D-manno-octulosonic-acid transferase